jgi:hypothetical protein
VLRRQIEIVDQIICALGRHAAQTPPRPAGPDRPPEGVWHEWEEEASLHLPSSACLHNPDYKRPVWEDFQMLRDAYRAIRPL